MKKAKIMLTALAVLAVVGGALAFKAQKTLAGTFRCLTVASEPTTTFTLAGCPNQPYVTTLIGNWAYCTAITAPIEAPCTKTKALLNP
jgi:hypothetical protein